MRVSDLGTLFCFAIILEDKTCLFVYLLLNFHCL